MFPFQGTVTSTTRLTMGCRLSMGYRLSMGCLFLSTDYTPPSASLCGLSVFVRGLSTFVHSYRR